MRIDLRAGSAGLTSSDPVLERLAQAFERGDLAPKRYARLRQERLALLGRELIAPSLEPGERVLAEHHWVEGHGRLPDAPFAEVAQVGVSLYVTGRRVFRWRFQDRASPDAALQPGVEETLEWRPFPDVLGVEARRVFRRGEAIAGLVIAAAAWALGGHLGFSGPILLAVGAFGVAHALAVPSRYVVLRMAGPGEGWAVWAARTRSGRAAMAEIAARLAPGPAGR